MKITKRLLKRMSDNVFEDALKDELFHKTKKDINYYKIQDDFLSVISISSGRSVGTLYLSIYTNLLTDPWCKLLSDYSVGARYEYNPITKNKWICENDSQNDINDILYDMCNFVVEIGLPILNRVNNYETYFIESYSNINPKLLQLDLAISMSKLGKFDKAYWMCEDLINFLHTKANFDNEKKQLLINQVNQFQTACDKREINDLLNEWKEKSVESLLNS